MAVKREFTYFYYHLAVVQILEESVYSDGGIFCHTQTFCTDVRLRSYSTRSSLKKPVIMVKGKTGILNPYTHIL